MTQVEPLDHQAHVATADDAVPAWRWRRGITAAALSAVAVGVPTDVIDTSWFTRMTPVRWWEYPVLTLTAVLTGLWFAMTRPGADERGRAGVLGTSLLSTLAVGCPVCNKIVLGILGVSGALGVWAPIQPALAALSLAALTAAVIVRWRHRPCTPDGCAPPQCDRASAFSAGDELVDTAGPALDVLHRRGKRGAQGGVASQGRASEVHGPVE